MAKTEHLNGVDYNNGDWFLYPCQHNDNHGKSCKRVLRMRVSYSSTMQCWVPAYKSSFDMRNQMWYCFQHR